jgi:hypothetical protein
VGPTRTEIVDELREVGKDLQAFKKSRDAVQHRINEMEGTPRQETFVNWAATQAILNTLIMTTTRCEGLIEDYRKVLESMDAPNNVVKLVERNSK